MRSKNKKSVDISLEANELLDQMSKQFKRPKSLLLSDMIYYFSEIKTDPKDYTGFRDLFARWTKTQEQKILYPIKNQTEKNADSLNYLNDKLNKIHQLLDVLTE